MANACPGNLKDAIFKLVYARGHFAKVETDDDGNREWRETEISKLSDINAVTFQYHVYGKSGARCGKITAGTKLSTHWAKGLGHLWTEPEFSEDMTGIYGLNLRPINIESKEITNPDAAFYIANQQNKNPERKSKAGFVSIEPMHAANLPSGEMKNPTYRFTEAGGKSRVAVLVDAMTGYTTKDVYTLPIDNTITTGNDGLLLKKPIATTATDTSVKNDRQPEGEKGMHQSEFES